MKNYILITISLFALSYSFAQPANDDPCSATVLTVNSSCVSVSGTNVSATDSPGVPAPGCANYSGGDIWYQITVPAGGSIIISGDNNGGFNDGGLAVYSGTCGSLTLINCNDDSGPGLHGALTLTGQTVGSTLWIRYWEYGNNSAGTFAICAYTPPPPPANDDCTGAYPLTINPDHLCGTTTAGTVSSATASIQDASACGGTEDDDVWFSFVATGTAHSVSILNVAGSTTDMYHSVWTGNCPALTLVVGSCSDANSQIVTNLIIGQTYFIRAYTWTGSTGQNSTFDVCIGTPPPPPSNDDCAGAISLTVNADNLCGITTTSTISGATASIQSSTVCAGTEDDDVWFTFVASGTTHSISISGAVGTSTDMYHSVWTGTCPGLTLIGGTCSNPDSQILTGLTIGQTYYIRVYTWTSIAGQITNFDICIGTPVPPPPCAAGLPAPNDACSSATLINTFDGYCGTTLASYTVDANTAFCGSIDNNSWLQFVASETSVLINWWITGGTSCTFGAQFQAFSGSCGSLTALTGSCVNPTGEIGNSGVFNFSGLTVGNIYYLMIDGYAGDVCDYAWQAKSGILPVYLSSFNVQKNYNNNKLNWSTKSEINNNYYLIESSLDGLNYKTVGKVNGNGNVSTSIDYEYTDFDYNHPLMYYKLSQVDFDGTTKLITKTKLKREFQNIYAYPNPAGNELNFIFKTDLIGDILIEFIDVQGRVISEITNSKNTNYKSIMFEQLAIGIYYTRILINDNVIETMKIVKI